MTKLLESEIHCPALEAAFERAMQKAFDQGVMPLGIYWPGKFGNHVSIKGTLEGSDVCASCGKKVEVDIHLKEIAGATNIETGLPSRTKIYDELDNNVAIKVSGDKCTQVETQR